MKMVDAHCHIGQGRYKSQTAGQLLERMDSHGVDIAVVTPVEEYIAVDNDAGNRYILEAVEQHADRLRGFAVGNPWFGEKAVGGIDGYLRAGLCGIKFNPSIQGFKLNDEIVYPFIELAEKHGVPVYFHTGTPITSIPFQLYDLAKLYPKVNFIMGHSGYSDFWNDVPYIAAHSANIWFDTSLSLTSRTEDIIRICGADKVVFSSDSPHSNLAYEISKVRRTNADDEAMAKMMGGNILGLLGGAGS